MIAAPSVAETIMPIYEYQCQQCKHKLEVMQRLSDQPLKTCPACAQDALKKLISAVGFQLKGTGWYETDFKNKNKPKPATDKETSGDTAKESATAANKESSKDSSAESKSADKSTTGVSSSTASD